MKEADYALYLYVNGTLIGDCRRIAEGLHWVRRRTKAGADSIDFSVNDQLFAQWCEARGTDINTLLKPMALECRIARNGVELVGGFLATMPSYSPKGASADLSLFFDGFLNLLEGVFIYPIGTVRGRMGALVDRFIQEANTRARNAGKAFGLKSGRILTMASVDHTFDNYKSTKEWICDRCDNTSGAGIFDVYFHADKTYDVIPDGQFGDRDLGWTAYYPARINNTSATSISAPEVSGFASAVLGIGAGEVSSNPKENTAITALRVNRAAVVEYGYHESLMQESSIAKQSTLNENVSSALARASVVQWEPQITLNGRDIAPTPNGEYKIWLGDTVTIFNGEDLTGQTNGKFRVDELSVAVSANGAETITPTLERVE